MQSRYVDERTAQERLEALIDDVQMGKIIVITRHGRPVAELRRYSEETEKGDIPVKGAT